MTEKLEQFRVLLKKLPPENYNNLRWVCAHYVSFLTEKCKLNVNVNVNYTHILSLVILAPPSGCSEYVNFMFSASVIDWLHCDIITCHNRKNTGGSTVTMAQFHEVKTFTVNHHKHKQGLH